MNRIELGVAQHLCVARKCLFHRATMLPNLGLMVSSVGAYFPEDKLTPIGGGPEDYYETMVFPAGPCTTCVSCGGWRVTDFSELLSRRYATEREAMMVGHETVVRDILAAGGVPGAEGA